MILPNTKKLIRLSLWVLAASFSLQSCSEQDSVTPNTSQNSISMNDLQVPSNFDWSMARPFQLQVSVRSNTDALQEGAYVEIYDFNPYTTIDGVETFNIKNASPLYKGKTNSTGKLDARFPIKSATSELFICPLSAGLTGVYALNVEGLQVSSIQIGGNPNRTIGDAVVHKKSSLPYKVLGKWDALGFPLYSVGQDVVSNEFLTKLNASLPEHVALWESHPEYLDENSSGDLLVTQEAEIWLTFVHEGAGQTNAVGYYTYPAGQAPSSPAEITNATIAFPNTSFVNSGGNLEPGDKVQLKYWNPETNQFQDRFPPNTVVAWFLESSGWSSISQTVGNGYYTAYSNPAFNPEPTDDKKKHNVLLYDADLELIVLGFEDLKRVFKTDGTMASDEDFNDAVFYITANPFTSIDNELDETDDGKDEPTEEHVLGTLAFEDLWPAKGDYDFNDLVVDYDFTQTVNGWGELLALKCDYTVRAIGASYHNGFAIELPIPASAIASVTGSNLEHGYIQTASNGTESGQSNAVIVFFDDAYDVLPYVGGSFVNTMIDQKYSTPVTRTITIELVEPVALSEVGLPPYNPFLIVNKKGNENEMIYRTTEVHLPNQSPTALANATLLGTQDDNSFAAQDRYYLSKDNLPWALNIPVSFDYPFEKIPVVQAYTHFAAWAQSGGTSFQDWYENKPGYRVDSQIYSK